MIRGFIDHVININHFEPKKQTNKQNAVVGIKSTDFVKNTMAKNNDFQELTKIVELLIPGALWKVEEKKKKKKKKSQK